MGTTAGQLERAKGIALRLLATRGRSRAELLERLGRRGVDELVAERVVADLERVGLLDDAALAAEIVESTQRDRPAGRALLEWRLERAAVDPRAGEAAVDAEETGELAKAIALLERESHRVPARVDERARWRRLMGLLARRGFDEETALEAGRRVLGELPEADAVDHDLDEQDTGEDGTGAAEGQGYEDA